MSKKRPDVPRKKRCACANRRVHCRRKKVKLIQKVSGDNVTETKEKETAVRVGRYEKKTVLWPVKWTSNTWQQDELDRQVSPETCVWRSGVPLIEDWRCLERIAGLSNRVSVKLVCGVGDLLENLIKGWGKFDRSEQWFWVVFAKIHVRNQF